MTRLIIASLFLCSSAIAFAEPAPLAGPAAVQADKQKKPDRMVCETIGELGSRLRSHRVCKPASEWAEMRREQRLQINQAQTQTGCEHIGRGC
jgi:hypothetical protein